MDKERWMCRFKASRAQLAEIQNDIATLVNCIELWFCLPFLIKESPNFSNHSTFSAVEQSNSTILFSAKRHGTEEFGIDAEVNTHHESIAVL